jgi:hypothetical protein
LKGGKGGVRRDRAKKGIRAEIFVQAVLSEIDAKTSHWQKQPDPEVLGMIGRITRAHLYVEHYLLEYVEKRNPNLGPVGKLGLQFVRILRLAEAPDSLYMGLLDPVFRAVNDIRNSVAHTLDLSAVKDTDLQRLREFLNQLRRPVPSEPVRVVEKAAFLGIVLLTIDRLQLSHFGEPNEKLRARLVKELTYARTFSAFMDESD